MEESQNQGNQATARLESGIQMKEPWHKKYVFWLQVTVYIILLLAGESFGIILGDIYFENGGSSNWLATLLLNVGFPVLIPFLFISPTKTDNAENNFKPSVPKLVSVYGSLGLLLATSCMLCSLGLKKLRVSTYSLVCASQLMFNAIFSVIFNGGKITLPILNSLVLLTISSVLLVVQNGSEANKKSAKHNQFALGFICTLLGSACYSLFLSLTELAFQKVFKKETFKVILDMSICQSLAATLAILIGFFASGDWKTLNMEMEQFERGKTAYIMNVILTAMSWQLCNIGVLGLILKVSSLFSNAIAVVGYPLTLILAVIVLKEKITSIKVISLFLAIWGILSYIYQNYLDDLQRKEDCTSYREVSHSGLPSVITN